MVMICAFFRRLFTRPAALETDDLEVGPPPSEAEQQFQAGLLCACGEGSPQGYAKAAGFYTRAAELNHALALFNLAIMHSRGQGVPRDPAKSAELMRLSAQQGDPGAQYSLGLSENLAARESEDLPAGASESRIEALKWTRLAAVQGYRNAREFGDLIVMEMTWEEVAEGNRRAEAFLCLRRFQADGRSLRPSAPGQSTDQHPAVRAHAQFAFASRTFRATLCLVGASKIWSSTFWLPRSLFKYSVKLYLCRLAVLVSSPTS